MKISKLIATVLVALTFGAVGNVAQAMPFTIGNTPSSNTSFFVQGQSFTAGVAGNNGSGMAPASGNVLLDSFTIGYTNTSSAFANLFIYASVPTLANVATGVGSLAIGTHVGGGVYQFANALLDVNTIYFALLPAQAIIKDANGNTYLGGRDMFPVSGVLIGGVNTGPGFDIEFSASFSPVPAPGALALLGLGLLAIGGLRRKKAA